MAVHKLNFANTLDKQIRKYASSIDRGGNAEQSVDTYSRLRILTHVCNHKRVRRG